MPNILFCKVDMGNIGLIFLKRIKEAHYEKIIVSGFHF
jgi:hypothetical protein